MSPASTRVRDVLFLLTRVVVGAVFLAHGLQKFFAWGIDGTASAFAGLGIPAPAAAAWAAALIETLGGIALIVGVALPVAGVLLAATMAGALLFAHAGKGLFVSGGGFEYVLVLAVAALLLGFAGGRFSLDGVLRRPGASTTS